MDKMDATYTNMLGLFAEMVLDEALRKYQEQRLYREIDIALASGDAESFFALTDELKSLLTLT
jgi:uncharacterized protein YpiB (UPF0302 family)